jgi:hypothetical protein
VMMRWSNVRSSQWSGIPSRCRTTFNASR